MVIKNDFEGKPNLVCLKVKEVKTSKRMTPGDKLREQLIQKGRTDVLGYML